MRSLVSRALIARLALSTLLFSLVPLTTGLADDHTSSTFQEWQVLDTKTGRPVLFEDLLAQLVAQDVVYLGEEHRNRFHIEGALKILQGLLARNRQPVLALEMFSWDGQAGLDRYFTDRSQTKMDFLRETRWEQNWGGSFDEYEPLTAFAREYHLFVLALNPPRALVRQVASKGMAQAMTDPDMSRWGMKDQSFPEDLAYHEMIVKPLRQCHGGLSDQDYERMYEASVFRDEGMAKTIVERLRILQHSSDREGGIVTEGPRAGPIVSYTGGGHVQYHLPVPNRVMRRSPGPVKQTSIYLTSFEPDRSDELRELMQAGVADYVWLTPIGAHGAPRRCR
jgi:uncharacterized iron-regulated protein